MIYRELANSDINTCLITGSCITISHPLEMVSKQLQSEFIPILEEVYPEVAGGSISPTIRYFLLDISSIGPRKLSAKTTLVSKHVREHGIKDFKLKYITI